MAQARVGVAGPTTKSSMETLPLTTLTTIVWLPAVSSGLVKTGAMIEVGLERFTWVGDVAVDEDLGRPAGRRLGGIEGDERAGEGDRGGIAAGAVAGDRAAEVVRQARRGLHPVRGGAGVDDLGNRAGVVGVVVVDGRQRAWCRWRTSRTWRRSGPGRWR